MGALEQFRSGGLLDKAWHETPYRWYFERTSDIARQLAFAGLGAAWLLSVELTRPTGIPPYEIGETTHLLPGVVPATIAFVCALAGDLLQYVCAMIAAAQARKRTLEPTLDPPTIAVVFLWAKIAAVAVGDASLIRYFAAHLTR